MRIFLGLFVFLLLPLAVGCPDSGTGPEPEPEPESSFPDIRATPPAAPADNDPAYAVSGIPAWSLVSNDLTQADDAITVEVDGAADFVDIWIDGQGQRMDPGTADNFVLEFDVTDIPPGQVEVLLAADGAEAAFARFTFTRSHPLYVLMGTDWDDADNIATSYTLQQELHDLFPELRITHFVGPYTWTDPNITADRVAFNEMWLHDMVNTYSDEVGVHIHPYCNFVETTDVPCRTQPSVVYDAGDPSGYTVESAAYTEEEYTALLLAADELFLAAGFEKPVSFRAGAWTADMSTLLAVRNAGYTVDSNAYNWAQMEEWIGIGNGGFYEWVSTNWSEFGDLSQPYYPSEADIQAPGNPAVPVLEIPLNGVMADYVTGPEMIEIFDDNWSGGALDAPVTYAIGYHPPNFDANYQGRLIEALDHVEQFLFSADAGPVVFATFQEMPRVWPVP